MKHINSKFLCKLVTKDREAKCIVVLQTSSCHRSAN